MTNKIYTTEQANLIKELQKQAEEPEKRRAHDRRLKAEEAQERQRERELNREWAG